MAFAAFDQRRLTKTSVHLHGLGPDCSKNSKKGKVYTARSSQRCHMNGVQVGP